VNKKNRPTPVGTTRRQRRRRAQIGKVVQLVLYTTKPVPAMWRTKSPYKEALEILENR
jgi:hypothetical protein